MDFQTKTQDLSDLLGKRVYQVPTFQRPYRWSSLEWEDVWSALVGALEDQRDYFMGPFLACREFVDEPRVAPIQEETWFIIDGQQRVTTLSILLTELMRRLSVEDVDQKDLADEIGRLLKVRRRRALGITERVFLNEEVSRSAFRFAIGLDKKKPRLKRPGRPPAYVSQIYGAGRFFAAKLAAFSARGDLVDLGDTLLHRMQFLTIDVPSDTDAFTVFETLNARGVELTAADLVKNLMLGRAAALAADAPDVTAEIRRAWSGTTSAIETQWPNGLVRFLRHYWIAEYEFVRVDEVYRAVSRYLRDPGLRSRAAAERLRRFATELELSAQKYSWLWGGDTSAGFDPGAEYKKCVEPLTGIRAFGAYQVLPVLLAALNHGVPAAEFVALCEAAVSMVVRRSLADQPPNEIERRNRVWCELIRKEPGEESPILGEPVPRDRVKRVRREMLELAGSGQTAAVVAEAAVPDSAAAKYLVLSVERRLRERERGEAFPFDLDKIDLEHILPKSPTESEWPITDWDGPQGQRERTQRLANLALWANTPNRSLKNRRFTCGRKAGVPRKTPTCCKRHAYERSGVMLLSEISKYPKWTAQTMDSWLARLMPEIDALWPYTPPKEEA